MDVALYLGDMLDTVEAAVICVCHIAASEICCSFSIATAITLASLAAVLKLEEPLTILPHYTIYAHSSSSNFLVSFASVNVE
jgi:hypothetical protein